MQHTGKSRALETAIAAALREPPLRARPLDLSGGRVWLKRVERLPLRMRLQKGSPARAFENERRGLKALAGAGLPVAPILDEGPDYLVTPDRGTPLVKFLQHPERTPASERIAAFAAAGAVLASLHRAGFSHGRPSVTDICWDKGRITLIDLERYRPRLNRHAGHVRDLVIFVFTIYAFARADCPEVEAACIAYRTLAPQEIWPSASRWCHRMRWIAPLSTPIRRWKPDGAREFHAIPPTLRRFAAPG